MSRHPSARQHPHLHQPAAQAAARGAGLKVRPARGGTGWHWESQASIFPATAADIALTYIYGVGTTSANKIVAGSGVDAATKVRDLSEDEVSKTRFIDQNLKVEGDLRREVAQDIKRKIENRLLPGHPPPSEPPGPWAAHAHQRAHPQGAEEDDRRHKKKAARKK